MPLAAPQCSQSAQCRLTHRSSGAPSAGRQARAGGTRYIVASPGLAPFRRCPLSSNVSRQMPKRRIACLAVALAAVASPWQASATTQMTDVILIDGQQAGLLTLPLAKFMESRPARNAIAERTKFLCTNNWRRYRAYWEIVGGELILVKVVANACHEPPTEIPLSLLFPDEQQPIVARWYTGNLAVGLGKRLPVGSSLTPEFDRYENIEVNAGVVTRSPSTVLPR